MVERWEEVERELLAEVPNGEQRLEAAVKRMDAEAEAYEATLSELRRLQGLTQVDMAERMRAPQSEVSRIENASDLRLSTLRRYVESAGGMLELVVRIPGRAPITLELSDLDDVTPPAPSPRIGE